MADIPTLKTPTRIVLGTASLGGPGATGGPTTTTNTANRAYAAPIFVASPVSITSLGWVNGNSVSGNIDVGIYDDMLNLLVSTGSIAQAGALTSQFASVASTLLGHGVYWLAFAQDNATGHIQQFNKTFAQIAESFGVRQMSSAFPLPSVWVPEANAATRVPLLMAYGNGEVM